MSRKPAPHAIPDDLRNFILQAWQAGFSASQIAKMVGDGRTKNSIIGLVNRARKLGDKRAHQRPTGFLPPKVQQARARARPAPVTFAGPVPDGLPATAVPFEHLTARHCRFPLWANKGACPPPERQFYCGAVVEASPYCPACTARTHRPAPKRTLYRRFMDRRVLSLRKASDDPRELAL